MLNENIHIVQYSMAYSIAGDDKCYEEKKKMVRIRRKVTERNHVQHDQKRPGKFTFELH